jgi:predicted transcriptional regulator
MNRIHRRDKMTIYGDLLSALRSEEKAERIVLIRVQLKIKVPFNRLKKYIEELVDLGLVQDETSLKIKEK